MSSNAELHLAYKVGNAELSLFPYPHFFVHNVFPSDFYAEIQANLPDPAALLPIAEVRPVKGYKERFVFDFAGPQFNALPREKQAFWSGMHKWLLGGRFGQLVIEKFRPFIAQRFGNDPNLELYDEGLLVQDITNYSLGPHTDSPRKVITFLFYLPADESQRHLGTSIYLPKDPAFRCKGGPHYRHDGFERVWTMPFVPNSLFAFFKTDNSFHGVEPVLDADTRRWLLLYDIYMREQKPVGTQLNAAVSPANVKFSF